MTRSRRLVGSLGTILLLSCGGGGGNSPTEPQPRGPQVVTIEVRDNSYFPKSVTVQPGDTVRWVLRGSDPTHTATAVDGSFDAAFAQAGAVFERRFDAANRTYDYSCQAHRGCCQMLGSIRVGEGAPRPAPGYE